LQHAIRLLNQLLTLSMAESLEADSSVENLTPIDLATCVQEIFEGLAGQAQSKGISLGFDMTNDIPDLRVNPWVVREMLSNLVDNAVRYTAKNGSVTVRIEVVAGQTAVVVEDNGPGISPEHRDKVFERFYRIHNTDSNGSGLGLAIVRELADHIGAQVRLADTFSGKGLAVWIIFARAV
jgi:two-component system sensor histidine kinase TctE